MPVVTVYLEGGNLDDLGASCWVHLRHVLRRFMRRGTGTRVRVQTVLGGSWNQALSAFVKARRALPDEAILLLVDSESAVGPPSGEPALPPHLTESALWDVSTCETDRVHLMVRAMEAWFLADRASLRAVWGDGLDEAGLPDEGDASALDPEDMKRRLRVASTSTDRKYTEGMQGDLLLEVDPAVVRARCPWCDRFLRRVAELASEPAGGAVRP